MCNRVWLSRTQIHFLGWSSLSLEFSGVLAQTFDIAGFSSAHTNFRFCSGFNSSILRGFLLYDRSILPVFQYYSTKPVLLYYHLISRSFTVPSIDFAGVSCAFFRFCGVFLYHRSILRGFPHYSGRGWS